MRENIQEIPKGQQPPAEEDSLYMKAYQLEKKKIAELDDRVIERVKFLEKQTDPKIRQMINDEIAELREKKSEARENANQALKDQRWTDEQMEEDISPTTN